MKDKMNNIIDDDMKEKINNNIDNSKKKITIFLIVSFCLILIYKACFPDSEIKDIIAIFIGIGFGKFILDFAILEKKRKKALNKYEDEHPEQIELTRIFRSKNYKYADKNSKKTIKPIIVLIVFGIVFAAVMLTIDTKYYETLSFFGIAFFTVFCLSLITIKIIKQKTVNRYIYTLISNKYGECQLLPTPQKKEIEGDMRNNYKFSCKILKYKCLLTTYYLEKFSISYYGNSSSGHTYKWLKSKYIFEYCYNLEKLGVKSISSKCLENENIKYNIAKLSKIKFLKIYIKEKYLVVEKESVVAGYKKEDAERDTNDIELFYNKIVKPILESK